MRKTNRGQSARNQLTRSASLLAFTVAAACLPGVALAQDATDEDEASDNNDDIVVTGTLIRGSAPVGANAITLGDEALERTGAVTANDLLATVPQVSNYFNNVPTADLAIAVNQIQIARPNLRNISPSNASSSGTLILVDGHRISSVGVNQASIDPDLIPTAAIERVEVVTEGGSATYGADAVAGVINFISRRRFDGVEVRGSYGFADNYYSWDASAIAGHDWESGSAYIAYSYSRNDALFGRDRDFIRDVNYASQPYLGRGRECVAPNLAINTTIFGFTVSSVNYAAPGFAPNSFNACDDSDNSAIIPEAERHGAIASLHQQLDDTASIDIRAYWGRRETTALSEPTGNVVLRPTNPNFVLPAGVAPATPPFSQAVVASFSFAPLLGIDFASAGTTIEQFGIAAGATQELGGSWQLRLLFNYGNSNSRFSLTQPNTARLNAAGAASTAATAINPFNIATTNRALVLDIWDNVIAGQARDDLVNTRAIVQGNLFELPSGPVAVAFGVEHASDTLRLRRGSDIRVGAINNVPYSRYSRTVNSAFAELQVPLFGSADAPLVRLSASGRYDDYSDFGDTFNPRFGITIEPTDWLTLRGNWGTSFTAPTPIDQLGSQNNQISSFPIVAFTRPGDTPLPGSITVAVQGSQPNLQPQEAETWSVGFEIEPPFISGLRLSASYYDVVFENILRTPTPNVGIFTDFPDNITTSVAGLTAAQLRAFAVLAPNGPSVIEPLIAAGTRVYETVDFRVGNFGILEVRGIDFGANFRTETGFGGVDFGVNGNYLLDRVGRNSPTAAIRDELLFDNRKLTVQSSIGADVGNFRAQATWNYNQGYDIAATTSVPVQTRVGSFSTVNLFFRYELPAESGVLNGLSFTLNVNNVFDEDPPVLLRNNPNEFGYANGFTVGRFIQFGVTKRF
jgi:iron complex outermembrane recepter protein